MLEFIKSIIPDFILDKIPASVFLFIEDSGLLDIGAQHIGLPHFLLIGAILFGFGMFAILTRKNAIMVLMGLELILNAANINFVAFSRFGGINYDGQIAAIFVIVLAAAEVAVALAILLNIYQNYKHIKLDEIRNLKN